MSANINYNSIKGEHSFFTAKEPAWHGLGKVVDKALNSEEAMKAALLDYQILKSPAYIKVDGTEIVVPNTNIIVRRDTKAILNKPGDTVTDNYEVVQNYELFKYMDDLIGGKHAVYETAGAIGKGEVVFATLKFPNYIRVGNSDDIIEQYLLMTSSHDKSSSITVLFTDVRVVCQNTLSLALKNSTKKIIIRHTKNARNKLSNIHKLLELRDSRNKYQSALFEHLSKQNIDDDMINTAVFKTFIKPSEFELMNRKGIEYTEFLNKEMVNKIEACRAFIDNGCGQELHYGSKLWLFNGISSYLNNRAYPTNYDKFKSTTNPKGYTMVKQDVALNTIIEL